MCFPAARMAFAWGWCSSLGEVTWTTRTASSASTSSRVAYAFGRPISAARRSPSSGDASRSPATLTPIRRSASMWTVPMKPLPMTAVPISLRRVMTACLLRQRARTTIDPERPLPCRNQSIHLERPTRQQGAQSSMIHGPAGGPRPTGGLPATGSPPAAHPTAPGLPASPVPRRAQSLPARPVSPGAPSLSRHLIQPRPVSRRPKGSVPRRSGRRAPGLLRRCCLPGDERSTARPDRAGAEPLGHGLVETSWPSPEVIAR